MNRMAPSTVGMLAPLLAASLLLSACGGINFGRLSFWTNEPAEQQSPRLVGATQYACEGNKRLAVRFGAAGQPVMVIFPEREFRLDPQPAGAGTRHSNGTTTLLTQGDEATLEEGGQPVLTGCKRAVKEKK